MCGLGAPVSAAGIVGVVGAGTAGSVPGFPYRSAALGVAVEGTLLGIPFVVLPLAPSRSGFVTEGAGVLFCVGAVGCTVVGVAALGVSVGRFGSAGNPPAVLLAGAPPPRLGPALLSYCAVGTFFGNSSGIVAPGPAVCAALDGAASEICGSSGNSGIGGTSGTELFAPLWSAAVSFIAGAAEVPLLSGGTAGVNASGGVAPAFFVSVPGHAGAVVSCASVAPPLVETRGGTPSSAWSCPSCE
jgi:hypothetical protein